MHICAHAAHTQLRALHGGKVAGKLAVNDGLHDALAGLRGEELHEGLVRHGPAAPRAAHSGVNASDVLAASVKISREIGGHERLDEVGSFPRRVRREAFETHLQMSHFNLATFRCRIIRISMAGGIDLGNFRLEIHEF